MSYYEQAEHINKDLKQFLDSDLQSLSNEQKEYLLNIIIQFGQVAKFRCRSNSAYDNFTRECFKNIAECKRVAANPGDEWATLRAMIKEQVIVI